MINSWPMAVVQTGAINVAVLFLPQEDSLLGKRIYGDYVYTAEPSWMATGQQPQQDQCPVYHGVGMLRQTA